MTRMPHSDFTFYVDEDDLKKIHHVLAGFMKIEKEEVIKEALEHGMSRMVEHGKIALKQTTLHPTKGTGNLRKSMTTAFKKGNGYSKGIAGFKRSTRKNKIGGGNHSYLVDRGTRERWQKTTGRYTGSVRRGRPQTGSNFWTNTVERDGPKVVDELMQGINDAMLKIMSRN